MLPLLVCMVLSVSDGDSMRVACVDQPAHISVRIAEIDAPEMAHPDYHIKYQPYGRMASRHLRILCLHKRALVQPITVDRFGRTVGQVKCNGVDVATAQVKAGMAWAFSAYLMPDSAIPSLQDEAQAAGIGLWRSAHPVPPWIWRKR